MAQTISKGVLLFNKVTLLASFIASYPNENIRGKQMLLFSIVGIFVAACKFVALLILVLPVICYCFISFVFELHLLFS